MQIRAGRSSPIRPDNIEAERRSRSRSRSASKSATSSPIVRHEDETNAMPDSQSSGESNSGSGRSLHTPLTPRVIIDGVTISPISSKSSSAKERYNKFKRKKKNSLYVISLLNNIKLSKFSYDSITQDMID